MQNAFPTPPPFPSETPVLIVGAGPAGLTSSLALARHGVDHVLVERHPGTAHTPRAHIVNQRTVEIMRHLGIEDRFHAVATPQEMMRNNLWVTTLAGQEILRSETWGTSARLAGTYRAASPCPMANCPQTVFEPMLVDAARDAGADLRFGHELETFTSDDDGITATVRNRESGEIHTVRARYLIGADGARSRVVEHSGLTVDGPSGLAYAANVWFEADLTRYLAHRPGVLTWNAMPGPLPPLRLGTLICHKPFTEFVFVFMYDPVDLDPSHLTTDDLVARVRAAVGDEDLEVTIKGTSGWQVNAQVAPHYSTSRVFCMGDAVHRHPPTNGLGLNMSVADAYNLAWKLALVLDGRAGPRLLDSYSAERQPVGARGVQRAVTSLGDMAVVDAAMGFAPGQSAEEGWLALSKLDAPGPDGDRRRRALRDAVELTDYQFNAIGLELGYRYGTGAFVSDRAVPEPEPERDPDLHFQSTTRPGARLPHARLEREGKALSTLDLVDGLAFALLTGAGGHGWAAAAETVTERTGIPIQVHVIGRGAVVTDPYAEWELLREVDSDGCVLVRPDRHVAWRSDKLHNDPADRLTEVFANILCLAEST